MTHPDEEVQKNQEAFLKNLSGKDLEYHSCQFRIGNAALRYHQLARSNRPTETDFNEWLEGLPENIRLDMREKGFEGCKGILSFTRYVNEKNDIGMDQWMKAHLSETDYAKYSKRGE